MSTPRKIIAIGGPTASGKSSLAIKIAKELGSEIISADSRQVYRYMNIGTAKGEVEKRYPEGTVSIKGVKHHLIDILDPDEEYNMAEFQKMTCEILSSTDQNDIHIIAGGTGLYTDSVLYRYDLPTQRIDQSFRKRLQELPTRDLRAMLIESAPKIYEKMTRSDQYNPHRLIRAIEKNKYLYKKTRLNACPEIEFLYLAVKIDRLDLLNRIKERVEKMFEAGLEEENRELRDEGYTTKYNSMRSIGYREFDGYFAGERTLEETKDLIRLYTGQYAKRQITWLKRNKEVQWISGYEEAKPLIKRFLTETDL